MIWKHLTTLMDLQVKEFWASWETKTNRCFFSFRDSEYPECYVTIQISCTQRTICWACISNSDKLKLKFWLNLNSVSWTHIFFPIGCNVFKLSSLNFSLFSSAAISWEQAGDLPVDSTLSSAWRGFSVLVCSKGHLFQLKLLSGWPGSSPGFGSFPRRKQRQMFVTWLHFGRKKKSERLLRLNLLMAESTGAYAEPLPFSSVSCLFYFSYALETLCLLSMSK